MGRNRMRLSRSLILFGVLSLAISACGGGEGTDDGTAGTTGDNTSGVVCGEGETTEVTFAPTAPLPVYWPYYYIADPLGFYEDAGIEISFENVQTAVQQSLMTGRLTFSGTGLDYIPQAPTLDDPPKWFMNVDRYLWVMVTLADSDVQSAQDLQGARIGINEPHDTLDADFMMGAAGVPIGEYELIPVGQDRAALAALEAGDIEAFVTAGAVSVEALRDFTDNELRIIENEAAESYYNVGSMLTLDQLENERDLAVCFGRAVARGMVWAWENPAATGELIYEMFPESAENAEQAIRLIEAGNDANRASYEDRGAMELEVYQDMVDTHAELELIDDSYDANVLFTNELIDDIWDFDIEAEAEAARTYEG
jgi:ABC-type nitrate/sulfonate/bicarbonate transport system substrate-binding protein